MADNFNFKQFLMENRLGAYSKGFKPEVDPEDPYGTGPMQGGVFEDGDDDPIDWEKQNADTGDESGMERDLEEGQNTIVVDNRDNFIAAIGGEDYKVLYDNHEEGDHIELQQIGNPKNIKSGTVKSVSEDGDLVIVLDDANDYTQRRKQSDY